MLGKNVVVLRDTRLEGIRPACYWYCETDDTFPLFGAWLWAKSMAQMAKDETGLFKVLKIMCHGIVMRNDDGKEYGGYGLELCKDGLDLDTSETVSMIRGVFDCIDIMACNAAEVSPDARRRELGKDGKDGRPWSGDGDALCKKIAQKAGCLVRASPVTQQYDAGGSLFGSSAIDFGNWEGMVNYYSAAGTFMYRRWGAKNYQ